MPDGALEVDYFTVTGALGRALEHDSFEFWAVISELNEVLPQFAWHNAMTDGAVT